LKVGKAFYRGPRGPVYRSKPIGGAGLADILTILDAPPPGRPILAFSQQTTCPPKSPPRRWRITIDIS
jgi:hypothetical protein